ncbi:MAG: hypothetical protein CMM07_01840 [Rhodopirellula sp.]|nr:hypothetical protein [Rhodopirellula sp.]
MAITVDTITTRLADQDLRGGNVTEAICKAIQEAGEFLSGPMPQQSDDGKELKDTLVLMD